MRVRRPGISRPGAGQVARRRGVAGGFIRTGRWAGCREAWAGRRDFGGARATVREAAGRRVAPGGRARQRGVGPSERPPRPVPTRRGPATLGAPACPEPTHRTLTKFSTSLSARAAGDPSGSFTPDAVRPALSRALASVRKPDAQRPAWDVVGRGTRDSHVPARAPLWFTWRTARDTSPRTSPFVAAGASPWARARGYDGHPENRPRVGRFLAGRVRVVARTLTGRLSPYRQEPRP